jgi:hypothetical protein
MVGRLFNVSNGTIRWHDATCVAQATTQRVNGRPPILGQEEHNDLVNHITDTYTTPCAWTVRDTVNHITERYNKMIGLSSIKYIPDRDPRVKSCRGVPMEERRLQVTAEDITT